jgi:hypothetical protein
MALTEKMRNVYTILVRKPLEKRLIPTYLWGKNVKMDLGWEK